MTEIPGPDKVRYVVGTYTLPVVVVCLVVAAAGVAGAWTTYANPPTTEVTDHENRQSVAVGLDTRATVEGESAMYDRGEELSNEPVYLLGATPNLTLGATVRSDPSTELEATTWLLLVYEARASGEVFWERSSVLATDEGTDADGAARTEATIDVQSVRRELTRLRNEVDDAGSVSVHLRVRTEYDTGDYEGTLDDRVGLTLRESSYSVGQVSASRDHSVTSNRERPIPGEVYRASLPVTGDTIVPHTTLLYALLALVGLAGAVATGVGGRRVDVEATRRRLHENRYDDWISEGTLPNSPRGTLVVMESLEGVVDVGIDAGKRVVFDPDEERYAVFDESTTYAYFPDRDDSPGGETGDSTGRGSGDATGTGAGGPTGDGGDDPRESGTNDVPDGGPVATPDDPDDSPGSGAEDRLDDLQIDSLSDIRADDLDDVPTDPDPSDESTNPDDE